MFRVRSEKLEQERSLLNRKSLETCPPELRRSLAYVLHLRSHWKPEGHAKLVVPTLWMEFLSFGDGNRGTECVAKRPCPFRDVQFGSGGVTGACLVIPDEELPREAVSQLLTDFGTDDFLATFVPRAFEGIPHTSSRSDVPAMYRPGSQGTPRPIDFALVPGHDASPESNTRCLLFGMKRPAETQHSPSAFLDSLSGPLTLSFIPEELTSHGRFHLTLLTSLMHGGAVGTTTEPFPEWLILFGLTYDAHVLRIIAYVPRRRTVTSDVIDCAALVVDQLSLCSGSITKATATVPVSRCELVVKRFRLLLALMTLRRHVLHLSKSLFTPTGHRDSIDSHPPLRTCDQRRSDGSDLDSESLKRRGSLAASLRCSSEYSTCPSSLHACESNDVPIECGDGFSSSCRSFASTFCSTCLSSLESASTSSDFYSEDSKYTDPDNYIEPSPLSGYNGSDARPNKLAEAKRQEIIAWAREVIPTEHPVKDTYKMVILDDKGSQTAKQVHADRY